MNEYDNEPLPSVQAALEQDNRIEAIRILRAHTGLGLKEAKDAVDDLLAGRPLAEEVQRRLIEGFQRQPAQGLSAEVMAAARQGNTVEAVRVLREETGMGLREALDQVRSLGQAGASQPADPAARLAPGEVPRGAGKWGWCIAGLVLLAMLVSWFWPFN